MAAVNYYIGIKRQFSLIQGNVNAGTATAGTAVDVEVRMQINDGSTATGLTKKDVIVALDTLKKWVNENGLNHAGANLPAN